MNNLKYYNDSLAYDFDMFMPRQKESVAKDIQKKQNIIKMPKGNQKKRTYASAVHLSSGVFASF